VKMEIWFFFMCHYHFSHNQCCCHVTADIAQTPRIV
jgi:hypothetical protein